ncbi:MAG: winged helix-turn-helix domain-containing protein [Dokdonella sp.]
MPQRVYRFRDCRIDLSTRELRRAGERVELSPKVFDCLAYLVERHQRAVGRDELVAAVWGKAEITDTLLGQTILKARRAIGDSADEQNSIRTIPRFGYTWVAAPDNEEADKETSSSSLPSPSQRGSAARLFVARHARWFALAAVALLAGIGLLYRMGHDGATISATADSAAVLPVDVIAPAEWSWVRFGLMDAIATRLREGGQAVVPSDNVVALIRAAADEDQGVRVRGATGAQFLLVSTATWNPSGWNVHLELRGDAASHSVDTRNADVLLAGRAAADRLLTMIGKTPPADAGDPQQWSDAKLLQSAEAALLTDDLAGARRLLQAAPAALQKSPELRLRLAKIDFRAGQFDAAGQSLLELLALTRAEADPVMRARILDGLGNIAMRQARADAAAAYYGEAVSLLENRGVPAELGQAYMGRGSVAQTQRRPDAARADFARARVMFELAGDRLALARVEANEGMLDASLDRYAAAATSLDRAAQRFERFGTLNELAMTTSAEIGAQLALLEPSAALVASDRAWQVRDRLKNARVLHALSINRALALDANGRRRDAQDLLNGVIAEADPDREKNVLAAARGALARIQLLSGRLRAAIDLSPAAMTLLDDSEDVRDRLSASLTAIRALRADGRAKDAADRVDQLSHWAESTADASATLFASLARAEQLTAESRNAAARAEYEHALDLGTRGGVPADIAEVVISYGNALVAAGDLERASTVVGQVARWAERDFGCALAQARLYAALGQPQAWQNALATVRGLAGDRDIPEVVTILSDSAAVSTQH